MLGAVWDHATLKRVRFCKSCTQQVGSPPSWISKRGDTYLRTLLIHRARVVFRVAQAETKADFSAPSSREVTEGLSCSSLKMTF